MAFQPRCHYLFPPLELFTLSSMMLLLGDLFSTDRTIIECATLSMACWLALDWLGDKSAYELYSSCGVFGFQISTRIGWNEISVWYWPGNHLQMNLSCAQRDRVYVLLCMYQHAVAQSHIELYGMSKSNLAHFCISLLPFKKNLKECMPSFLSKCFHHLTNRRDVPIIEDEH